MNEQNTQSPLERAARALAVNNGMDAEAWGRWEEDARAVLMAIREPSAEMGNNVSAADCYAGDVHAIWQAMIDAALEG